MKTYVLVIVLIGFLTSCVTTNFLPDTAPLAVSDEKDAQVIVHRLDSDGGDIGIFIDGAYAGKLGNGQTGMYQAAPDVMHKIQARFDIDTNDKGFSILHQGSLTEPPLEFFTAKGGRIFNVKFLGTENKRFIGQRYVFYTVDLVEDMTTLVNKTGIEGASARAAEALIEELPRNATIAVLSVSARNRDDAAFTVDELEFRFVDSRKFKVVDRKTLDAIRSEQNFQLSGDVDDKSAVSIGKMLGASIVVTGTISGTGNSQRLTLKVLDVKTAEIVTMARESF